MPIANVQDAREVAQSIQAILSATGTDDREQVARTLFVETLDFEHADLLVPLGAAKDANLPSDARMLASRDGFSVLYIPLDDADDNQVKTSTAAAAARVIGDNITDEPILLFTNRECDQLHVIYPDLSGEHPQLQHMVAYRGQPETTVVQQIADLWHEYSVLGKPMSEAMDNAFSDHQMTGGDPEAKPQSTEDMSVAGC